MSLGWVIVGSFIQLGLAGFLMMLAIFAGGGLANGRSLTKTQTKILDASIFALPGISLLSGAIVIFQYANDGSAISYWWHALPIVAASLYVSYMSKV